MYLIRLIYNLASIYQALCDFEQAKEYQQCDLEIQLDKLGPEHVNVATCYHNLASLIYKALGDFEQAKEYRQRALGIQIWTHRVECRIREFFMRPGGKWYDSNFVWEKGVW